MATKAAEPRKRRKYTIKERDELLAAVDKVNLPRFRGHPRSLQLRHDKRGVHEPDQIFEAAQEAAQLHARVQGRGFVIGPSGSGKSSLVAAGVLPRLARGLSGLGPVVVRELRPGDQPFSRLCQALDAPPGQPLAAAERVPALLAHRAPGASALIVVDQLEELFTQASAEERAAFLDTLRARCGPNLAAR